MKKIKTNIHKAYIKTSTDFYKDVGAMIRELRKDHCGTGLTQEDLAKHMGVLTNTVSRWETAESRPTAEDLNRLARFFQISITAFFPQELPRKEIAELLRITRDMKEREIEEVIRFASFRRTTRNH